MEKHHTSGLTAFAGFGCFLAAWALAPGQASHLASHPMLWVVSGTYACAGAVLMLQWLTRAERRPSPWPTVIGRVLWALRPRAWMLAWAAIVFAGAALGTPHLLWRYEIGGLVSTCDYVGWRGLVRDKRTDACLVLTLK